MLRLVLIAILSLAVAGCATVKRDPIPVAEVHFLMLDHHEIITVEPVKSRATPWSTNGVLHNDYRGQPDCIIVSHGQVSKLTAVAQYLGRVSWSGVIPEVDVPESAFDASGIHVPVLLPGRVQAEIREKAARKGGNIVILNLNDVGFRWVMENKRLQPEFLFFSKVYYVTNAADQIGFSP